MGEQAQRTVDLDGRAVVFDAGSHLHLALGRPWMLEHVEAILATVALPDHRAEEPIPGRERFYRRHLDGHRWLRVVVDFSDVPARVVSAQRSTGARTMITIAGIEFDHCHYDARGDVLYLSVGQPREPADAFETPEGHNVEYDEHGSTIGVVLYAVRHTLDRDGELSLTWPPPEPYEEGQGGLAHLAAGALEPALAAA